MSSAFAQETSRLTLPANLENTTRGTLQTEPWRPPRAGQLSEVYDFTTRSMYSAGAGSPDAPVKASMGRTLRGQTQSNVLGLRYGLSDRWALRLVGAIINNQYVVQKKDGTEENVYVQGPGDMRAQAVYSIYDDRTNRFEASGGTTIPTGATDLQGPDGKPMSSRMQLGSGTFDLSPGISYTFSKNGWQLSDKIEGVFHMGKNSSGYTNGDEYSNAISASYRVLSFLTPVINFSVRNKQRNKTDHPLFASNDIQGAKGSRKNTNTDPNSNPDSGTNVLPGPSSPQDSAAPSGWSYDSTVALRSQLPLGNSFPVRASVEFGVPLASSGKSDIGMKTAWFAGSSISGSF